MKRTTAILLAAACLAAGCGKNDPEKALEINLNSDNVTLSQEEPANVTYSSANAVGTIHVSTESGTISISEQSYDDTKQTGTFTLSTSQNKKETVTLEITFKDNRNTVKKELTARTKSTWSVDPTEPQPGPGDTD